MSWLTEMLNSIFHKKKLKESGVIINEPSVNQPVVVPTAPVTNVKDTDIMALTRIALDISQSFEGDIRFANPTGDGPPHGFDGMGLTMGALGWTFGYGDQQRLVQRFISKYGRSKLLSMMPRCGEEYITLIYMPTKEGTEKVKTWSSNQNVNQPYRQDLITFWTSPEMVDIQIEEAASDEGQYSDKMAKKLQNDLKIDYGYKHMFLWFFDVRVMNGSMKNVWLSNITNMFGGVDSNQLENGISFLLNDIVNWSGYDHRFIQKNIDLWRSMKTNDVQKVLMILGYERAKLARPQFRAATMFRRGTLAFGQGYVNSSPRDYTVELGLQ